MTPEEKTRRLDVLQRLLTSSCLTYDEQIGHVVTKASFNDEEIKKIKEEIFKLL